jgi:opacity protein-like surface antigen
MRRVTRRFALAASGAAILSTWPADASAQLDSTNHWRYGVTPYLWLTGLSGRVGVGPVAANVDLGAHAILDLLKFGLMGTAEARKGPWVVGADGIYASLGAGRTVAFRGDTGRLELTQSQTIIQPTGGYTVGAHTWAVDILGGFRYWHLSASLDVDRTRRPSNERSGSRQWVDATGGFRFRWLPTEILHVVAAADGGGGGARSTWQAYGSLGVDPWSHWTLGAAYRWLSVDYDHNNFLYDTDMKGFILGATYRFQ